jgi:hypothetical protein
MKRPIHYAILALALSALACSVFVGGPAYPEPPIAISTEAVAALKDQLKAAMEAGVQTGQVTVQINESQLSSYLAFKLESQTDPLFTDPQVLLRDGRMQLFGQAHRGGFTANIGVVLSLGVDAAGQPVINITQADFGPFPVPSGLNEAISALIREAFTGSLGPVATGFRMENIAIADGIMTVTGRIK